MSMPTLMFPKAPLCQDASDPHMSAASLNTGLPVLTQIRNKASSLARGASSVARKAAKAGVAVASRATARLAATLDRPDLTPTQPPPLEPGRRHLTEKPHHLTLHGWGEVAWKIWEELFRDRLFLVAAGVAFFTLLAIFPALSALVAVWSLFGDPQRVASAVSDLAFILPPGGIDLLRGQADLVAANGRHDLTVFIVLSILVSTWSANAGMKSVFEAMNIIYNEDEKRSFLALNLQSLLFTLGAAAIFLATIGFVVVVPVVLAWFNLREGFLPLLAILRWPALFLITVVFLTLLNRYGPSRRREQARWSVWGSTLGAFMWLAVSLLFSFYVGRIANFTATYGSLAAIAGLMTWLWLSALVILIGVELTAELEHRSARWDEQQRWRMSAAIPKRRVGFMGLWDRLRKR